MQNHSQTSNAKQNCFDLGCRNKVNVGQNRLIVLGWLNDIVNFENHFAHLSRQEQLLLLTAERFKNILFPHVVGSNIIAVNTQVWVAL